MTKNITFTASNYQQITFSKSKKNTDPHKTIEDPRSLSALSEVSLRDDLVELVRKSKALEDGLLYKIYSLILECLNVNLYLYSA